MNILGSYKNGNYNVTIYDDGTKVRENELDFFKADFPENIDIKITNFCDINCAYCHENSNILGKHCKINHKFFDSLKPCTELAIGGGNVLSHPNLVELLEKFKSKNIISNITVNQIHFEENYDFIKDLCDRKLVYGVGVSLLNPTNSFIEKVKSLDNIVIHVINGIVRAEQLTKLSNNNLKLLILGYKKFRKGADYYNETIDYNMKELYNILPLLFNNFKVVSFDNKAIEQLNVKRLLSENEWNEFYMGDDGQHTMYIDLVEEKFALNSTSEIRYDLKDDIGEMFKNVQG